MGNPAYNASKTGAVGLTRTLGEAWAENGIRVNGIAPGSGRHQDDQGDDDQSEAPRRRAGADPAEAARHARRHGRRARCSWPRRFRPTSSARPSWSMAGLYFEPVLKRSDRGISSAQERERVSPVTSSENRSRSRWTRIGLPAPAKDFAGKVESAVGDMAGDAKTQAEGRAAKRAGTVQNLYGQAKDAAPRRHRCRRQLRQGRL